MSWRDALAIIYIVGFLVSYGWAMAASAQDPELKGEPDLVKVQANILFALLWPLVLLRDLAQGPPDDPDGGCHP